ncbi:hypothetical protein JC881_07215 [Variovorax sp. IB41]|nr:hypothetical protein [Variovorax sp. IB41]
MPLLFAPSLHRSIAMQRFAPRHIQQPAPARASKACSPALARRTEVHGRTHKGQTARHAVIGPANRSFVAADAVFPYIPQAAACCNHFVMSLSQSPSFRHR